MKFKLAAFLSAVSCLPALCLPALAQPASPHLPAQGSGAIVTGRAHIWKAAQGTYILVDQAGSAPTVAGFIPFGDETSFRGVYDLEGRMVAMKGVIVWDGRAMIVLTDPNQLSLS